MSRVLESLFKKNILPQDKKKRCKPKIKEVFLIDDVHAIFYENEDILLVRTYVMIKTFIKYGYLLKEINRTQLILLPKKVII